MSPTVGMVGNTTEVATEMYDAIQNNGPGGTHMWFNNMHLDFIMEDLGDGAVIVECLDTEEADLFDTTNMSRHVFARQVRDFADECSTR